MLDLAKRRGVVPVTAALDKNYDAQGIYADLIGRKIRPGIALIKTARVKRGEHRPPACEHGAWTFARPRASTGRGPSPGPTTSGARRSGGAPGRACKPASVWIKYDRLHPPIPHGTDRRKALYRGGTAVERFFGRAKNEAGLAPCECAAWTG